MQYGDEMLLTRALKRSSGPRLVCVCRSRAHVCLLKYIQLEACCCAIAHLCLNSHAPLLLPSGSLRAHRQSVRRSAQQVHVSVWWNLRGQSQLLQLNTRQNQPPNKVSFTHSRLEKISRDKQLKKIFLGQVSHVYGL